MNDAPTKLENDLLGNGAAPFRRITWKVILSGYVETPKRISRSWIVLFYLFPLAFMPISIPMFRTAIAPVPALEQTTVVEGKAHIWEHPSRGVGTIHLILESGEKINFGCRDGTHLGYECLPGDVIRNKHQYEGTSARVWTGPPILDRRIAYQIEINSKIVRSYDYMLREINSTTYTSNTFGIVQFIIYAGYWLFVLIGFPLIQVIQLKRPSA